MRLIDADKLMPIYAPIAGIITGELTHYEKIVFWETIYEAPTIDVFDRVLEIIDKYATFIFGNGLSEENQIALWDGMRDKVMALKGGEQE